jgi:NifU-like protein involved in Fe-S cluster formation
MSTLAMEHVQRPVHRGPLEGATHYGVSGSPGDGPYVQIWLKISGGTIEKAAFKTPGCPSSTAAAGVLCTLVTGREPDKAKELSADELLLVLGGLPEGKGHYADEAIEALRCAITKGENWS